MWEKGFICVNRLTILLKQNGQLRFSIHLFPEPINYLSGCPSTLTGKKTDFLRQIICLSAEQACIQNCLVFLISTDCAQHVLRVQDCIKGLHGLSAWMLFMYLEQRGNPIQISGQKWKRRSSTAKTMIFSLFILREQIHVVKMAMLKEKLHISKK